MHKKQQRSSALDELESKNHATALQREQEALPTEVGELDAMRIQLANEKAIRLQAQLQLLQTQHAQATAEFEKVKAEAQRVTAEVWAKYQLGPEDTFHNETRKIDRKPPPPQADA